MIKTDLYISGIIYNRYDILSLKKKCLHSLSATSSVPLILEDYHWSKITPLLQNLRWRSGENPDNIFCSEELVGKSTKKIEKTAP